jgi:hypothetical protein
MCFNQSLPSLLLLGIYLLFARKSVFCWLLIGILHRWSILVVLPECGTVLRVVPGGNALAEILVEEVCIRLLHRKLVLEYWVLVVVFLWWWVWSFKVLFNLLNHWWESTSIYRDIKRPRNWIWRMNNNFLHLPTSVLSLCSRYYPSRLLWLFNKWSS